jgi:hypothetical protein
MTLSKIKYHYYPDHDQQKGVKLRTLDEKVLYLAGRMNKILIKPIEEIFKIRTTNTLIWDLNVSVCTLICEGISGLSTYYHGSGNGCKFRNFVEDYLYPSHQDKKARAYLLWHGVRCSLSHGFYIRQAWIETDKSKHYSLGLNGRLIIDLETFFDEFKLAVDAFLSDVLKRKSVTLVKNFESRFDKVFPKLV